MIYFFIHFFIFIFYFLFFIFYYFFIFILNIFSCTDTSAYIRSQIKKTCLHSSWCCSHFIQTIRLLACVSRRVFPPYSFTYTQLACVFVCICIHNRSSVTRLRLHEKFHRVSSISMTRLRSKNTTHILL